mmetsp:Transcript_24672/g.55119  ORF Transcript_24672/g.55119 Transcript_24672/m.55119 type:complete len:110 (+) Transcript_24672:633-962(+)
MSFHFEDSVCAVFISAADAVSQRIETIKIAHDLDLLAPTYSLKFEITEPTPPPRIPRRKVASSIFGAFRLVFLVLVGIFAVLVAPYPCTCLKLMSPLVVSAAEARDSTG